MALKRLYLDSCSINRPFDARTQLRVRLEADAVSAILGAIERKELLWVISDILLFELLRCPDEARRKRALHLCSFAAECVDADAIIKRRADALQDLGLRGVDAVHLACAERAQVDTVLTTDDRFIAAVTRLPLQQAAQVSIMNPLSYVTEGMP